jgi:hypothetical protein
MLCMQILTCGDSRPSHAGMAWQKIPDVASLDHSGQRGEEKKPRRRKGVALIGRSGPWPLCVVPRKELLRSFCTRPCGAEPLTKRNNSRRQRPIFEACARLSDLAVSGAIGIIGRILPAIRLTIGVFLRVPMNRAHSSMESPSSYYPI